MNLEVLSSFWMFCHDLWYPQSEEEDIGRGWCFSQHHTCFAQEHCRGPTSWKGARSPRQWARWWISV